MDATSDSPVYLAIDFGAGSGRVIAGILGNGNLRLEEVHRFSNDGVQQLDTWHWQVNRQFNDVLDGLKKAADTYGSAIRSVGVDTWGVDYGLIDKNGRLLGVPVQYRDSRTDGIMDRAFAKLPAKDIYRATGNQFMFYNTLFQLMAEQEQAPERLDAVDRLLFMPDLFNYWLCGTKANEATIASTGQLVNAATGEWATGVMEALNIPTKLFGDIVQPGTVLGDILPSVTDRTGLNAKVVAVGSHDTASAYAAVPSHDDNSIYLSSGTWSLLGVLSPTAIINDESYDLAFTNERAVGGEIRLLKILCGLWLIQECKRSWDEAGSLSWETLIAEAEAAKPFQCFIDPDDPRFATPGNMPNRLVDYCRETGQTEPATRGLISRMIFESLALKYRVTTDALEILADRKLGNFHVVGGGCQNALLNQFTANALGRTVIAGPVEATAAGNILCQLLADDKIATLQEGGDLIKHSFDVTTFTPESGKEWEKALLSFKTITGSARSVQ
jgi:sugar (pentulose or hexulose) kinase